MFDPAMVTGIDVGLSAPPATPSDEAAAAGEPGAALLDTIAQTDVAGLRADVATYLEKTGVRFGGGSGWPFTVDPVPRILSTAEWATLAAGLEQRVRALDAFVRDAYGPRRSVAAGVVTDEQIEETEGYEPLLRGVWPEPATALGVSGLDVVRDADGTLLVLEDNLRTPSGLAYAVAARRAVVGALSARGIDTPAVRDMPAESIALLAAALRQAAPAGVDDPQAVVLTDGPSSVAHYEHAWLAAQLGVPLVTLADLERTRFGRLRRRDAEGHPHDIDVVYRRTDSDLIHEPDGALTPVAAALLEPWLDGRLGLVNGFGTGVGDDKLTHAHVEDAVRLFLGEEPLLRSVPTLELGEPDALARVLDDPRAFVVKARHGEGGKGVTVCRDADDETLSALLDELRADPAEYVAQLVVPLSTHPTVVDDGVLEPRHVDLRPFVFLTPDGPRAAPGGLTRVALRRGSLVVNSSQQGGAKDTWVLA
ncbi:MAG: circularly permuted type 2 ATP-grasp protein [Solirubrobacteraceae bacterium]